MQQSQILYPCRLSLILLFCVSPILLWAQPKNYIKNESQFFNHVITQIVFNEVDPNMKFVAGFKFNYDSIAKLHNRTSIWVGRLQEDSTINQVYYYQSSERWLSLQHVSLQGDSLYLYCRSTHPNESGIGDEIYIKTYIFNLQTNQYVDSLSIDIGEYLGISRDTLILSRDEMPCNIIPTSASGDSLIIVGSILNLYNRNTIRYNSYYFVVSRQGEIIWEIPINRLDSVGTKIHNPLASGAYFQNQFVAFSYASSNSKFIFRFNKEALHTFTATYSNDQCDFCFKMPVTTHVYDNNLYAIGMIYKDRASYLQIVKYDTNLNPLAFRTLDNRMPGTEAVYYSDYLSTRQFSTIDKNGNIYLFYTYPNGNMNVVKLNSKLDILWRKFFDVNKINWGVSHVNLTLIENKLFLYGNYCNDLDFDRDYPCDDNARHAYIYVMDTSGFITSLPKSNFNLAEKRYELYPNPTRGEIDATILPQNSKVDFFDAKGRNVYTTSKTEDMNQIQLTHKGIHFYIIYDETGSIIGKGKIWVY